MIRLSVPFDVDSPDVGKVHRALSKGQHVVPFEVTVVASSATALGTQRTEAKAVKRNRYSAGLEPLKRAT